jgi:hypothetical protein
VQQVKSYPSAVHASASMVAQKAGGDAATSNPPDQAEWLGPSVAGYTYDGLAVNAKQAWSAGSVVVLRYARRGASAGSGELVVQEFRIAPSLASVLQVVADGSATSVTVGGLPGVYVDGRWLHSSPRPTWESGARSELIFERDGLIFWIVADQRDGMGQDQLVDAAGHLATVPLNSLIPQHPSLRLIAQELQGALQAPMDDDVLALIPRGSSPQDGQAAFVSFAPGTPLMR